MDLLDEVELEAFLGEICMELKGERESKCEKNDGFRAMKDDVFLAYLVLTAMITLTVCVSLYRIFSAIC